MADLPAEVLTVTFHNDRERRYHDVSYCLWSERGLQGVTVYAGGVQVARHEDVLRVDAGVAVAV